MQVHKRLTEGDVSRRRRLAPRTPRHASCLVAIERERGDRSGCARQAQVWFESGEAFRDQRDVIGCCVVFEAEAEATVCWNRGTCAVDKHGERQVRKQ